MLVISPSYTTNPHVRKLPYDPNKDFKPVSLLAKVPSLYLVHPDRPDAGQRHDRADDQTLVGVDRHPVSVQLLLAGDHRLVGRPGPVGDDEVDCDRGREQRERADRRCACVSARRCRAWRRPASFQEYGAGPARQSG